MKATGNLEKTKWGTPEERFWSKVDKEGGEPTGGHRATGGQCWRWLGAKDGKGYGQMRLGGRVDGRLFAAHRIAYELVIGPIPNGMELDHLCRVVTCVNPEHLEPVTHHENILRIRLGLNH